ncbi:ATP-binding protein [Pseudodesulfovibrio tunisiensis]|uniref:ATP-binding protein n=1 Tax=Pseudodesulfovibrio tunisiensis TaxID=463192 RepID=UPI001FB44894|nr:transporter substrate-binding domain-containing protein [Pseudodesulfovibrio tunisiensis]
MQRFVQVLLAVLVLMTAASCSTFDERTPLTVEEREWISRNKEVRLGVSLHYPPYEEYGLKGGYEGLSADYVRLINEKTGLRFVPVRFRNRDEVLREVKQGNVDVVAALEMTEGRREYLDFTQPYVTVPAAIITRKEFQEELTLEKLDGMRIGVTVSPEFTRYLKKHYPGEYTIVPMAGGYIGGLRSLAVGDVDALICDMALASRYIANARISNLRIAGITNYTIDLRIASLKASPILGSILRKGLAMILPHERKVIEERWLTLHYRPIWASWKFWIGLFSVCGAILGGVVLVLVWNRSLKRQVAQRTMALSSINKVLLGSLECHTEHEVMLRCLEEAENMSSSERAFLGEVAGNGVLKVFLATECGERAVCEPLDIGGAQLSFEQMEALGNCQVVQATLRGSDGLDVHVIMVPLHILAGADLRIIAVGRRQARYVSSEVSLLAEVLFAFEEALQRKRTEISLHEKERQLQRVQRMEALGTLAGGIAHDFNNILGVIIANGEMVEMFHLDGNEPLAAKVQAMLAAAYRGRDLVSQILTFTRKSSEEAIPLNLGPIVKETIKFLEASLPASITMDYEIASPERTVLADPTQVHQVLMNLCTNAAHAMENSGGTMSISVHGESVGSDRPETSVLKPGPHVVLSVRDMGGGIPPEVVDRIFDPFFTTKMPGKGTGLGLAMVQGIVKSWGGEILVRNEPGRGAEFRVYIPAMVKSGELAVETRGDTEICSGCGCILLVDDEDELVSSCSEFLTNLGYKVHGETDSLAAAELFCNAPGDFDLVITDYNMPGLRGDKFARKVLEARPGVPVILCSGYSHRFDESAAASLGIREYLKKPISLKALAMAVRKYLKPDFSSRDEDFDREEN